MRRGNANANRAYRGLYASVGILFVAQGVRVPILYLMKSMWFEPGNTEALLSIMSIVPLFVLMFAVVAVWATLPVSDAKPTHSKLRQRRRGMRRRRHVQRRKR